MFGFHPFSTQSFSEGAPFIDVQTTTNLLSASLNSAVPELVPNIPGTNLALSLVQGTVTGNQIKLSFVPSGYELAAAISSATAFTWAQVDDTTSDTWSDVNDTTGDIWTQVDDETNANVNWTEI
jgi:hypothetical protein|tara:strand:+ start:27 stop:398 length:372 start_codon:yes stop_codon:yes gene_type:complete